MKKKKRKKKYPDDEGITEFREAIEKYMFIQKYNHQSIFYFNRTYVILAESSLLQL